MICPKQMGWINEVSGVCHVTGLYWYGLHLLTNDLLKLQTLDIRYERNLVSLLNEFKKKYKEFIAIKNGLVWEFICSKINCSLRLLFHAMVTNSELWNEYFTEIDRISHLTCKLIIC